MTGKLSDRESRYAIARFATEVFPAMLAAEGPSKISSFWPMVFYFSVIVMNLGSLIVLFGTVVDAVMTMNSRCMNGWRPSIAFSMCALAFVFSLPLATRFGLHVMYFIDFCFGSLWWMSLLYLLFIISILVVRGRPVGTENLVNMLVITKSRRLWVLPLLTFHWNLMIPVAIMILSVSFTRSHSINGLTWTQVVSLYTHWPPWAQWLSVCVQVFPLLIVFIYGLFKATFILTTSPKPLHERLQELFCPILTTIEMRRRGTFVQGMDPDTGVVNEGFREDPPPKYTPPPSYSAATSRNARRQLRLGSNITIDIPNLANIMTTPPTDQSQEDTQRKQSVVSTSSQLASSSTSQVKASHSMTNK
jgi:solute carrier family 6 (neurotransmitter transporter)